MKRTLLMLACLTIVMIYCCGEDSTQNNGTIILNDPGILRTDEFGNELGGDTTDWCRFGAGFRFAAAYPNPTNSIVHLRFDVPAADTIKVFFLKPNGDTTFFMNSQLMAGVYTLTINDSTRQYANTFQRAYISSTRNSPSAYCRFYGDIRFEP